METGIYITNRAYRTLLCLCLTKSNRAVSTKYSTVMKQICRLTDTFHTLFHETTE